MTTIAARGGGWTAEFDALPDRVVEELKTVALHALGAGLASPSTRRARETR